MLHYFWALHYLGGVACAIDGAMQPLACAAPPPLLLRTLCERYGDGLLVGDARFGRCAQACLYSAVAAACDRRLCLHLVVAVTERLCAGSEQQPG